MWKEPDPDPGGDPPDGSSTISRELSDLKDENEQQKLLIAQLRGMLRNEQSNMSQEKIDEYVNTLKKMTAKKSRVKKEESSSSEKHITIESGKTEKLNLLKQQLEKNKARLAERGKSQKGIEEMVTQLKAELNDSQQLINSGPLFLVDPKTLDYSKTSNPEELYNILLMKEQKITELMSRTQKQEAKILDLQENLKEKDSVIDARTKAITLMTDSLSKKGKTTLDALDETKEQMRKMQENFVTLEKDMKARQMKLLEDLKTKNLEIQELKEVNEKLLKDSPEKVESDTQRQSENMVKDLQKQLELAQQENKKNLEKISELDGKLQDSLNDMKKLKNVEASVEKTVTSNDEEFNKLKKQLDESNKNMIKIKAQSKSKIKDLTKKLETFKKMSDSNALIAELQNENTKLSEKVAELEEEKGNMQLKMVESSDSLKDSTISEELKQLQDKNNQYLEELNEKDKVITLLEADIIALKEEIANQNSQISNLAHLENVQVTSEMKSIQIEEQLDQLETENSKLKEEINNLHKQNNEISITISELTKEKQELTSKLENYIQENMDLIDKLEKLSAEKVSSAESIEIVEGLTQQEKLELAAYQKTMDVNLEEPIKIVEDHDDIILEAPPELNESVHRLTEDSAELLNKIEMFNAERKEVMNKMEALKEENNILSMKVQEIENNRDILADTYEQLQTEKEDIFREKEVLEEKLKKLESGLENNTAVLKDSDVSSQLHALQAKYEKLLEENNYLRATIKDFDSKIHEKHELECQLIEYRSKIENLENKLQDSLRELSNYEAIIEDNKNELISSANTINNLEVKLNDRETEINELNVLMNDLNGVVNNLQAENEKVGNFEMMETKFEELKTELSTQIEQAQDYAEELEHNKELISDLNEKLIDMNRKILDTEHEIEIKNMEMEKLKHEILNKDDSINILQVQLEEKDEKLKLVTSEMKDKYLVLQKQLDGNNGSLEKQIKELTVKNKEQLEKMKKIAANLKKKTQAYQELEQKYNGEKEKWETELKEKESLLSQVKVSKEEIDQKTNKLDECEARMTELTEIVQSQEQELENLRIEMRRKQENLHEVSLKQELSTSLHEEFDEDHSTNDSIQADKIKELELIIEMKESELSHYKDRLQKIEQDFEKSLEDREQFERKSTSLEEQLSLISRNMEEKALVEQELGQKLQQISANDEVLVKKLEESTTENSELTQKIKEQEELIMKLKIKLKKAHEKVTQLKSSQQALEELETANNELKKQLVHLESVHRHTQEENENLQRKYQSEYEKIENDYQTQLEELVNVRNELMVECEKLKEHVKACKDKEDELLEEISDLKLKMDGTDKLAFEIERLSKALVEETRSKTESLEEIEQLTATIQNQKLEVEDLQKQLVAKAAEKTVEEVVELASDCLIAINTKETQTETNNLPNETAVATPRIEQVTQESVPTFQWPEGHETPHEDTSLVNIEQPFVQAKNPFAVDASIQPSLPPLSDLESQMLSESDIVDAANNRKALQEIEFEKVGPSFGIQSQAIVEEVVKPKQAYLTYQPGAEAFGENDDGWGWGPEESKLEEEHQNRAGSTPQVANLKMQLAQALDKLQVLQLERENHLEEIKQLQVKSGKLIKKCKDLKTRNDQLIAQKGTKKQADEFFDLNDAIQDELKSQITQLEKRIKEITAELEKEKAEKKNILNRVDVLTVANERMLEMKEIQDTEVLRWRRKFEESEEKLQQYEWGSDGFSERPPPKQPEEDIQTIEELQRTIKELSLDNEELQSLLNEQRDLRLQAEKSKVLETMPSIPPELENKIKHLEQELTIRNSDIQAVLEEKSRLIDSLQVGLSNKEAVIESLEGELFAKSKEMEDRTAELKNLHTNNYLMKTELQETAQAYHDLKQSFDRLKTMAPCINELRKCLEEIKEEKQTMETLLNDKDNQFRELYHQLNTNTSSISSEVDELKIRLDDSEKQRNHLQEVLNEKDVIIAQLRFDIQAISSQLLQSQETTIHLENAIKDKDLKLEILKSAKFLEEYSELSQYKEEKYQLETLLAEKDNTDGEHAKIAYKQLRCVIDDLAKQNLSLRSNIENLNQNISKLQNDNLHLQEFLTKLELKKSNTNESSEKTVEELKQQLLTKEMNAHQQELQNQTVLEEVNLLKTQKQEVDFEIERLKLALEEKQREFELVIADLELKWAALVDERGNSVAEQWKNHLGMVEAAYAEIQEKAQVEIRELDEKCKTLLEENNELRKNVNAEVSNEVDRISVIQQQVHEKQQALNDLNLLLSQAQHENNLLKEQLASVGDASEKDEEIKRLKFVLDTTQQQFEEKREVLEEIVKILETFTPNPITFAKEDIMTKFNEQLTKISKYENDIQQLTVQIEDLKNSSNVLKETEIEITNLKQTIDQLNELVQEKDVDISRLSGDNERLLQSIFQEAQDKEVEIFRLNELIGNLQLQVNNAMEKDDEIVRLKQNIDLLQEQLAFMTEKDQEITSLHGTIEDYKKQISQLQEDFSLLQEEKSSLTYYIEDSKRQLDEAVQYHDVLQTTMEQQNQQIQTLNQQLQQYETYTNDSNKAIEQLEANLAQLKEERENGQKSLAECQQQLFSTMQELSDKTEAFNDVVQQLNTNQQHVESLENDLISMRQNLESKEREYVDSIENLKKAHFTDIETHYEEVLAAKDLDLEKAKTQLQESLRQNNMLIEKLDHETELKGDFETKATILEDKTTKMEEKLSEQLKLMEEEEKQLEEMRGIIEEQLVKIEDLKKELFAKSNDYDSLIAEMDMGRKNISQQQAAQGVDSASASTSQSSRGVDSEDLSDPVSRAELDLALYMLHQRDVRCEELTVELTELLEERDTLQLRLSNAIREKEELRSKVEGASEMPKTPNTSSVQDPSTPSRSKSSQIFLAASGAELATEAAESLGGDLANKLSELKMVGYKKDKTFVDEQHLRRLQQMSIMQQHIKEAAKLPPEAAAKLVEATYTLSRDVQSPSKVILDWLWGRSTPKQNDT